MRRFLGLTWCGWLNFVILQWTGFRLQRVVEGDDAEIIGWRIAWHPPWRHGWTLPRFRKPRPLPPALAGRAVYRTAGGGRVHLLSNVEVREGDPVMVTARGLEAVPDDDAVTGRWTSSAKAGDVAELAVDFGERKP